MLSKGRVLTKLSKLLDYFELENKKPNTKVKAEPLPIVSKSENQCGMEINDEINCLGKKNYELKVRNFYFKRSMNVPMECSEGSIGTFKERSESVCIERS